MEISGSSAVSSLTNATTNDERSVAVLKKALDVQADTAATLIESLPEPSKPASNLPDHIGKNIDTTA